MNPHRRLITAREAAQVCGVAEATIRDWVRHGVLSPFIDPSTGKPVTYGERRKHLFIEADVLIAERTMRSRRKGTR